MAIRVVNGNTFTEDGWPLVDRAGCNWVRIPGSDVTIQVQMGLPTTVLAAWNADWNAYVEPLNDATTACWTEGNSVLGGYGRNNGSNHLGGTSTDSNWHLHPMGPHAPTDAKAGFTVAQVNTMRDMIDYYTFTAKDGRVIQIVWWANDWNTPHDSMHSQMGYDTYDYRDEVAEWCKAHIRPDGFSMFRRGAAPSSSLAAQTLSAATGLSASKVAEILPTLCAGLRLAKCTNLQRIAMFIAQTRHESDNYSTTREYGTGQRYAPYIGRTWIQITWESNYEDFGKWAAAQGLISDPNQFVNNPQSLEGIQWAGIGAAWYWTVQRPGINAMCDNNDIVGVTQAINGGQTHIDLRRKYWNQALAQGDSLLSLVTEDEDEWMTNPEVVKMLTEIHRETVTQRSPSRSFMAEDGKPIDSPLGIAWNTDGNAWTLVMTEAYRLDVTLAIQIVEDIAENGVAQTSWAGSNDFNEWLRVFGQEYCQGLVAERNDKQVNGK